jgi:guanosine-3',5'-bis(diphosphate) 3'-pyrophosphohydrolase
VHTEVGHACIGAKVNGRLVSLDHVLASGDNVEIFTSKVETAGPSQDWLSFVASPRARNKIRQWFSRERRVDMVEAGRDDLTAELRRERLPVQQVWKSPQLEAVVAELSYVDLDALLAAIGEHHVSAKSVAQRIAKGSMRRTTTSEQLPPRSSPAANARRGTVTGRASTSRGSTTCSSAWPTAVRRCPATRSSGSSPAAAGVSVHRSDCANACRSWPSRRRG